MTSSSCDLRIDLITDLTVWIVGTSVLEDESCSMVNQSRTLRRVMNVPLALLPIV